MDGGDVNFNEIGDNVPEDLREIVEMMTEIVSHSRQEIYAMLVGCANDANEAINRLLSQDVFQQVKSKRNKKKQPKNTSYYSSQRIYKHIQDRELMNDSDHYGNEQMSQVITSSTTSAILTPNPPLNSDLTNVETVPSLPAPSSPNESVNQASLKDDCPLDEKPDNLFMEDPSESVVTSLQKLSIETDESKALVKEDKPVLIFPNHLRVNITSDLSNLRFGRFDPEMNGSEFTDFLYPKHLNSRDEEEEVQGIRKDVANEQIAHQIDPNENPVVAPSEPSLPMQNYNTFLQAMHQDLPFNQSLPTNQINTIESSFGRRPSVSVNEEAVNHHYSQPKVSSGNYGNTMKFPHSQAVQIGGDNYKLYQNPSLDEVMRNINLPRLTDTWSGNTANSRPKVPSGNYGNVLHYPHSQPKENDMLPSGFQQNYGRNNNNTYHDQSVASTMLPRYIHRDMPHRNNVPSANGFGLPSDEAANVLSSQLNGSNHLPSIQHQNGNPNVWPSHQEHNHSRVNSRNDYYRLFPDYQNEQPQSLRRQEPQPPYREIDYRRSNLNLYNRRNPSEPNPTTALAETPLLNNLKPNGFYLPFL